MYWPMPLEAPVISTFFPFTSSFTRSFLHYISFSSFCYLCLDVSMMLQIIELANTLRHRKPELGFHLFRKQPFTHFICRKRNFPYHFFHLSCSFLLLFQPLFDQRDVTVKDLPMPRVNGSNRKIKQSLQRFPVLQKWTRTWIPVTETRLKQRVGGNVRQKKIAADERPVCFP